MSFIDGLAELFKGKKTESPTQTQPNLDQRIQDLQTHTQNLETMMAKGGADFRNAADSNALDQARGELAKLQEQKVQSQAQTAPQPETQPEQPVAVPEQIPVQQPQEEPQVA